MTTPCDQCPFLKASVSGMNFPMKDLRAHASGEFACHKTCDVEGSDRSGGTFVEKSDGTSPHCAGALIFLEKRGQSTQMMRIAERLGMYDRTKLNIDAPVR